MQIGRYLDHFSGKQGHIKFEIILYAHQATIHLFDLRQSISEPVITRTVNLDENNTIAPAGYINPCAAAQIARDYRDHTLKGN